MEETMEYNKELENIEKEMKVEIENEEKRLSNFSDQLFDMIDTEITKKLVTNTKEENDNCVFASSLSGKYYVVNLFDSKKIDEVKYIF